MSITNESDQYLKRRTKAFANTLALVLPHDTTSGSKERVLACTPDRMAVEDDGNDISPCLRSEKDFARSSEDGFRELHETRFRIRFPDSKSQ